MCTKIVKPLNTLLSGCSAKRTLDSHNNENGAGGWGDGKKKSFVPWQWDKAQQAAYNVLEEKLSSPFLACAGLTKPYILHTDASTDEKNETVWRVIAFDSSELRKCEGIHPAHNFCALQCKWIKTDTFHKKPVW